MPFCDFKSFIQELLDSQKQQPVAEAKGLVIYSFLTSANYLLKQQLSHFQS